MKLDYPQKPTPIRDAIVDTIEYWDVEEWCLFIFTTFVLLVLVGSFVLAAILLLTPHNDIEEAWYGDDHVYIIHDKDGTHVLMEVPNSDTQTEE